MPVENRIGGEGDGFVLAQKRLNGGRIHHAMRWVGQCNRAFEMMCERAVSRTTKGQLLGQKQMIQEMIADSAVEIRALRLLALHSAWVWDTEGRQCEMKSRSSSLGREGAARGVGARYRYLRNCRTTSAARQCSFSPGICARGWRR